MIITFLIGNGFDRNLGLKTTYADFVKHYKTIPQKSETLKNFQEYIQDNEELWSSAEIAMGEYTSKFDKGAAAAFSECHTDFCEQLALYLKNQMSHIDYNLYSSEISKAFSKLNQIIQNFPTQERDRLNTIYRTRLGEQITFNFICFNYTDTLDKCLSIVKTNPNSLGSHKHINKVITHSLGQICHVHGTVDKEMVFGVHDESQIAKLDIFDCEDGDVYKNMLIKIQANASFLENTDAKASQLIKSSNLIYIYGMSIGATDKLWWDRICTWLNENSERHLIVQKYDMPQKSVIPIKYQIAERELKREITKHSSLDAEKKTNIQARMHITGENIFDDIHNIAMRKKNPTVLDIVKSDKTTVIEDSELFHAINV